MSRSELATFAAGSFWGVQAAFRGVALSTRAGYMGGHVDNPSPAQVATGTTGHAEVVEVTYDPDGAHSFAYLLLCFWQMHDCTRQPRHGPSALHPYRSVVFFHTAEQEEMARDWLASPEEWAARMFPPPAHVATPLRPPGREDRLGHSPWTPTTEILPATAFWPAPPEEQDRLQLRDPLRMPDHLRMDTATAFDSFTPIDDLDPTFATLSPAVLRTVAGGSETRLKAIVAALNRSLRTAPAARTGSQPEAVSLGFASAHVNEAATQSQVTWTWPGIVHVFTTNFRPGNFLAHHDSPAKREGFESWIGAGVDDPATPSAGGSGGMVDTNVLIAALQGTHLQPKRQVPPATDLDPERVGAWHEHLPDAEFSVEVEPHITGRRAPGPLETHPIRWHAGELLLEAHPAEAEQERALAALGGHRCACLDWYILWQPEWIRQGWYERSVLAELRRHFVRSALPASTDWLAHASLTAAATHGGPLPHAAESRDPAWQASPEVRQRAAPILAAIRRMPENLLQRWLLGALGALEDDLAAGCLDDLDRINHTGLTLAPLASAVAQTLWQWCRHDPTITYGHAVHRLLGRGEPPIAQGFVDGDTAHILVGVPFEWLTRVWSRGLDIIDGHLVLDVDGPAGAADLDVLATDWVEDGGPGTGRLVTWRTKLSWAGDRWQLYGP